MTELPAYEEIVDIYGNALTETIRATAEKTEITTDRRGNPVSKTYTSEIGDTTQSERWVPFAPSAIKRADIAVWRYGVDCHPIHTNDGKPTAFDLDLVLDTNVIIKLMF